MKPVILQEVSLVYPGGVTAADNVSFELAAGIITAVCGESGSGKTSLLRLIAGFEAPDQGRIYIGGHLVAEGKKIVYPEKRRTGIVFQDLALFPHLTVAGNIAFGLGRMQDRASKINALIEQVGLQGLGSRYPHQLSGGQQQRVAIARAVASDPDILLLDEPFSSLDPSLRAELRAEIRDFINKTGIAALLVTHDPQDAFQMADRMLVIQDGRIIQDGTPEEVYRRPVNAYAARLAGHVNSFPGAAAGLEPSGGESRLKGIRPEDLQLARTGPGQPAIVRQKLFSGSFYRYTLTVGLQEFVGHSSENFSEGQEVFLIFDPDKLLNLDE